MFLNKQVWTMVAGIWSLYISGRWHRSLYISGHCHWSLYISRKPKVLQATPPGVMCVVSAFLGKCAKRCFRFSGRSNPAEEIGFLEVLVNLILRKPDLIFLSF